MPVLVARRIDEALAAMGAEPHAEPLAGGTDLMVEINFGRKRLDNVVAIDRLDELKALTSGRNERVRVGGGVTYTRLLREGTGSVALAEASRTVGSPQIRNAGTLGGNVATSSPAGDTLPVLAALEATIVLRSARGERRVPFAEFMTGPKRSVRHHDELVIAAEWDDAGPAQTFIKVGTRNAMVIAVCSFALALDAKLKRVGTGIGSAAPTPVTADEAEAFIEGVLDEGGLWEKRGELDPSALVRFGELVAAASRPIDDVRGTAAYRRHALAVLARRTFAWAWDEYRRKTTK